MPSKLLWLMIVNVSLNLACYILPPNNGDSYSSIPCVFPFKYKGLTFHACTKAFDFQRKLWCSVKVNDDGEHSEGDGNWGHCDIATCVDIERAVDPNNRICQTVSEASIAISDRPIQEMPKPLLRSLAKNPIAQAMEGLPRLFFQICK